MRPINLKGLNDTLLRSGEWLAENAYVAPGTHRLLTAFGLMAGLSTGRHLMDVMTATDRKGNPTDREEVLPPLQRFHGIWKYNKYDDSPEAKWHRVIDNTLPVFLVHWAQ